MSKAKPLPPRRHATAGKARVSEPTAKPSPRAGPPPPPALAVLRQFRELFRVSQQHFQRVESRCGVSGAQLWALSELRKRPGITVSTLARTLSIHLSTASNLVGKLELQRLARRERSRDDRRVMRVFPTPAGTRILTKAPRPVDGVIPDALHKMPPGALARLSGDLGLLLELASVRNRKAALKPLAEP